MKTDKLDSVMALMRKTPIEQQHIKRKCDAERIAAKVHFYNQVLPFTLLGPVHIYHTLTYP